jgi:hypothetical protein
MGYQGALSGSGETGKGLVDHRVIGRQRNTEVTGHLDHSPWQTNDLVFG